MPVILMTGDPTADTAIQAMNLGAFDYVVKPLELDELIDELEPLIAKARKHRPPDEGAGAAARRGFQQRSNGRRACSFSAAAGRCRTSISSSAKSPAAACRC